MIVKLNGILYINIFIYACVMIKKKIYIYKYNNVFATFCVHVYDKNV